MVLGDFRRSKGLMSSSSLGVAGSSEFMPFFSFSLSGGDQAVPANVGVFRRDGE
jgi:hypothetical protein